MSEDHKISAKAPRVIILTDFPPIDVIPGSTFKEGDPPEKYSDPDDVQSLIRLLLYANDLEIEALVASACKPKLVIQIMSHNIEHTSVLSTVV